MGDFYRKRKKLTTIQLYFLILSSVGILLFGSKGNGIYNTLGKSYYKLRDTIKEHTRMHELRIAHGHNGHNHNKAEHIYWDIALYLYFFDSELRSQLFFISILSGALLSLFIFYFSFLIKCNVLKIIVLFFKTF